MTNLAFYAGFRWMKVFDWQFADGNARDSCRSERHCQTTYHRLASCFFKESSRSIHVSLALQEVGGSLKNWIGLQRAVPSFIAS